jgi:hypothetical protein
MEVTVSAFEQKNLSEIELDWLFHFRQAKSMKTLDIMIERLDITYKNDIATKNNLNVAYCVREKEINSGVFI